MGQKWYRSGSDLLRDLSAAPKNDNELYLWYLGQCGFVFKSRQVTLLIDCVLTDLTDAEGRTRRHYPPPFDPTLLSCDYVLCTHGHRDHLTPETVTAIARGCPKATFIVPEGCTPTLEALGIASERILGVRAGETVSRSGLVLRPVQAAHPIHQRDAQGRDTALCCYLELGGMKLLHLGDTYLTDQLLSDLTALPSPDLFFTPINGGDYFRTKRNCIGNLNPRESVALSGLLHADVTIPTHYDMMEGNTADALDFVRLLLSERPDARWRLPALGERLIFQK